MNVKCVTLRVREHVDMIETPLRSIINSGTMDVHNDSHIFYEELYRLNHDVEDSNNHVVYYVCIAIIYLHET